jgi:hypothetical protein
MFDSDMECLQKKTELSILVATGFLILAIHLGINQCTCLFHGGDE